MSEGITTDSRRANQRRSQDAPAPVVCYRHPDHVCPPECQEADCPICLREVEMSKE